VKQKTEDEIRLLLRRVVGESLSLREWGRRYAISPAYISRVLKGDTRPGVKILDALGYERVTVYREKDR